MEDRSSRLFLLRAELYLTGDNAPDEEMSKWLWRCQ